MKLKYSFVAGLNSIFAAPINSQYFYVSFSSVPRHLGRTQDIFLIKKGWHQTPWLRSTSWFALQVTCSRKSIEKIPNSLEKKINFIFKIWKAPKNYSVQLTTSLQLLSSIDESKLTTTWKRRRIYEQHGAFIKKIQ